MLLGAAILCIVLWGQAAPGLMAAWIARHRPNQAWRGVLARAFRRARPGVADAARWGRYWSLGSALAGALWGVAAVVMYPASPAHEALLIVCLFGVDPRRPQPHRGVQAVVLRLRAAARCCR